MYIIGIDPGSLYTGISVYDIDDNNFNINTMYSRTLDLTKISYDFEINDVTMRTINLYNIMYNIFNTYKPYWLAIESGFMNRLRPQAYGPLSKVIFSIEKAYIDSTTLLNISEYPPKYVKKIVSTGVADKDDMYEAISNIEELKPFIYNGITEHEIDAIAIGYTRLLEIRNNPISLFPIL